MSDGVAPASRRCERPDHLPEMDWRTTIQAYWQTVNPHEARLIIKTLRDVPGMPDVRWKLSALLSVPTRMHMDMTTSVDVLLQAGVTREPHDLDRVAGEILKLL